MGLPVSFQEHSGALVGTVLTGTWGKVMPLAMQAPGCSDQAVVSWFKQQAGDVLANLQADATQPFPTYGQSK